jgi:hypothetical protein
MTNRGGRRGACGAFAATLALAVLGGPRVVHAECPRDVAEGAYADARRAFDEKRFDDSVALLRKAYACDPKPVYLGNVARAYEEANRPRDALEAWRAYLAVMADERERSVTEGRISALTKMVEDLDRLEREKKSAEDAQRRAEAAARERLRPAPQREAAPSHHIPAAAWVTAIVGAAGLATGAAFGAVAVSQHNSAVGEMAVDTAEATQHNARTFAQAANWSLAIGGAIAAVGVTWIGIDLLRPASPSPSANAALVVSGTTVAVTGSF